MASTAQRDPSILPDVVARMRRSSALTPEERIRSLLLAARTHLGMPVAFVSEFSGGRRWFRYVETDGQGAPIAEGSSDPLEDSYCYRVTDGRLPPLLVDASAHPESAALELTNTTPIGSHISVPIRFSDGAVYGTFCAFAPTVDRSLVERDVAVIRMLADFAADNLEYEVGQQTLIITRRRRVQQCLEARAFRVEFQPIVDLETLAVAGHEALGRFADGRSPGIWFREAQDACLTAELEFAVARMALERMAERPPGSYLAINLSPEALLADGSIETLLRQPLDGLVIELTEHDAVGDYVELQNALRRLQAAGAKIAVDDAGAGYSSLSHILELMPDYIKLDASIVCFVAKDPARQHLIEALGRFAGRNGMKLIAEGVEYRDDADCLKSLGVRYGQGFLFAPSGPEFLRQF